MKDKGNKNRIMERTWKKERMKEIERECEEKKGEKRNKGEKEVFIVKNKDKERVEEWLVTKRGE